MPYFDPSRPRPEAAAERRDFGGDNAGIDADDAVLQRFADAEDAAQIAGVEIGGETELGIVGTAMTSASSLKRNSGASGPKVSSFATLALSGTLTGWSAGRSCRPGVRFAAGDHLRTFGDGIGNVFFNFGHGFLVDQRAGGDAVLQAVANAQFFHRLLQLLGETVIHPVRTYRRLAQTQVWRCGTSTPAPPRLYRGRHRQRR